MPAPRIVSSAPRGLGGNARSPRESYGLRCLVCAALVLLASTCAESAGALPCDAWQSRHPEWLFCDDFESREPLGARYQDVSTNGGRFGISDADAHSGTYALRQHYDAGQVEGGWVWRMFGRNPNTGSTGPIHREIHARWFHKFEAGFAGAPPKMARLRGFTPEHWRGSHTNHFWISSGDGRIVIDPVSHVAPGGSVVDPAQERWLGKRSTSFSYQDPANIGRWVCLEMRVKLNDPGAANGVVEYFADGQPIGAKTGQDFVGAYQAYGINGMMWDTYWNGGSPKAQARYYDDFVISTGPIGCESDAPAAVSALPAPALLLTALSLGGSGGVLAHRAARRHARECRCGDGDGDGG